MAQPLKKSDYALIVAASVLVGVLLGMAIMLHRNFVFVDLGNSTMWVVS